MSDTDPQRLYLPADDETTIAVLRNLHKMLSPNDTEVRVETYKGT